MEFCYVFRVFPERPSKAKSAIEKSKKARCFVEEQLTSFRPKNDIAKVTKASRPASAHGKKYGWVCK